jgi:hypothetical protein
MHGLAHIRSTLMTGISSTKETRQLEKLTNEADNNSKPLPQTILYYLKKQ